jgi:multidrug resistance efflux pump
MAQRWWPARRSDLEAAERAMQQLEAGLAAATRRAEEAEGQARSLREGMGEKDAMLKYVEEEVDRVKGAAARCPLLLPCFVAGAPHPKRLGQPPI